MSPFYKIVASFVIRIIVKKTVYYVLKTTDLHPIVICCIEHTPSVHHALLDFPIAPFVITALKLLPLIEGSICRNL